MSYFFTTIIGVIVGAAIVLVAKAEWKSDPRDEAERGADNPRSEQKESMQKQIENFLNYDGSASGQVSIGDDE